MAKYSFEFKKKIVQEYLNGYGRVKHLVKIHGITHYSFDYIKKLKCASKTCKCNQKVTEKVHYIE